MKTFQKMKRVWLEHSSRVNPLRSRATIHRPDNLN
jgi:hypothetical protein